MSIMENIKNMKIGIIGTGSMGKKHVACLKKIKDVKIVSVLNINLAKAEKFKKEMELTCNTYDNFDKMLKSEEFNALYFCIPPFAHNGEVIRAAENGINVFLEKPIALNSTDAETMVNVIEKNNIISQVGYQMRFRQSIQKLYTMISNGTAGKPTLFQGRFWCNIGEGSPWWAKKSKSGGQIFEQIIHIYDLALSLFGEPQKVYGVLRNILHQNNPNYEIEDTSLGVISFKNGSIATITGSNCSIPIHFFGDFQICFENVSLEYKSTGQHWIEPDQATLYYKDGKIETFIEDEDTYYLENVDFINSIKNGTHTKIPAKTALKSIQVIEDIINSNS